MTDEEHLAHLDFAIASLDTTSRLLQEKRAEIVERMKPKIETKKDRGSWRDLCQRDGCASTTLVGETGYCEKHVGDVRG